MSLLLRLAKLSVLPHGVVFGDRRPGLIILVYHRVGGGTDSEIDLPVELFERQMAYLRQHYTVVSLDVVDDGLGRALEQNRRDLVAVTFDDGHRELYEHAFPVMVKYRIPAMIYLATAYVDEQRVFDFGTYRGTARPPRPLTWPQVREMVASGLVMVGAHTHTHADLTRLPAPAARDEIVRGKTVIEDRLGVGPRHFAYPWGALSPSVKAMVGAHFLTAVRGGTAKNTLPSLDPLALWRRPVQQSDGFWFFRLKIRSYLDGEEALRRLAAQLRDRNGSGSADAPPKVATTT